MITKRPFGTLSDGTPAAIYRLTGGNGAYVDILDYGATIVSIVVPDKNGSLTDVVLGYDDASGYEKGTLFLGATVGRHANRIGGGCFTLNGTTYQLECNDGPNHLHGGSQGYHQRLFAAEIADDTLKMSLISPDGDQGYPGEFQLTVEFSFSQDNRLTIHYLGTTTKDTVVNLTNHSYFDLSGGENAMGQILKIDAEAYTENDANTLPTGVIAPVAGTPFDFRTGKPVGQDLTMENQQLAFCKGYDHNFVLPSPGTYREFASLTSPLTGITMAAGSDLPGMQLYGGNFIEDENGKNGRHYTPNTAICLETQFFPNAMAVASFEKPILRAGETYDHVTTYRFGVTE